YGWTARCALQVISYVENRSPEAAGALVEAIRGGKIGFQGLFANLLTGLLDHETLARVVWPAGLLARERGLGFAAAQLSDVPGQTLTFPTVLAASGVRYLATGPNPDRAVPLLSAAEGAAAGLAGDWPAYPQVYWWEGPDGGRVLHWRAHRYGDATRFGFDVGPEEMGRRLSDWLLTNPVFLSPGYAFDIALLYGASAGDNAPMDERLVQNMEEFNRRFAFPRIVPGRAEDFFRDLERRWGAKLPVRRGDTGCYWEDGAASAAAELARFRRAQLAARAAARVRRHGASGRGLPRRLCPRPGARRPRAGLSRAGRRRAASAPGGGRRRGARRAGGRLPPGARLGHRRYSVSHWRRRQGAGQPGRLVRAEPARVRARGGALGAVDRRV